MRIITGDECGLVKEVIPELSHSDVKETQNHVDDGISRLDCGDSSGSMCRGRGTIDFAFCNPSDNENNNDTGEFSFCTLRMDGSLERWSGCTPSKSSQDGICTGNYTIAKTIDNVFQDHTSSETAEALPERPIRLCSSQKYQYSPNTSTVMATCSSMGSLSIIDVNEMSVKAKYSIYSKGDNSDTILSYTKGNHINRDIVTSMDIDSTGRRVVAGGRERSAVLIDAETGNQLWKAKNLPPHPQTLLSPPIWSTAMMFLSPTGTESISGSADLLAIGTAYKQLQIYDIRTDAVQRRPVLFTPEWDSSKRNLLDHRVTSLCQLSSNSIAIGDAAGYIHEIDLRKITRNKSDRSIGANIGRFTGPAGSVRQLIKHETLPVLACVGLDRMLRLYDLKNRKQTACAYLKQRLNCMLFCSDDFWDDKNTTSDEATSIDIVNDDINGDTKEEDRVEVYIDSSDDANESNDDSSEDDESDDNNKKNSSDDNESDDDESDDDESSLEESRSNLSNHRSKKRQKR